MRPLRLWTNERPMARKRDDDAPPLWLAIALAGAGILGAGVLLILVLSF